MTQHRQTFTDAERMELRSYVQLAGEVIAQYWPMRTFIHHNPLHGLEGLHFDEAIKRGAQLFGGRGYLSNQVFRRYFKSGRIRPEDLQAIVQPLAADTQITFAGRPTSHLNVLMASMIHGISETHADPPHPEEQKIAPKIEAWLTTIGARAAHTPDPLALWDSAELPVRETCATWCDRTFGTTVVDTMNREMVKWCSAFLDEGEASWSMPGREQTFYRAWKSLAQHDASLRLIGITSAAQKIAALSDRPEEALLESLTILKIPKTAWEEYLSHHLAALPGWTGYIKWRADQSGYPWQQQYPIDLVKYLAVRLFYERELIDRSCRDELGIPGDVDAIRRYMDSYPHAYWFRREWVAGRVEKSAARQARRRGRTGRGPDARAWDDLGREQYRESIDRQAQEALTQAARRLLHLARALAIDQAAIESTTPSDVRTLLDWLEGFPASQHGPRWLEAFEASHRREVLDELALGARQATADPRSKEQAASSRSLAQVVFCIDVRSEVYRRHLEQRGGYETLGLAGFFGVPLDYQPFGAHHAVAHCPVLLKPKNRIREIPRSYHGSMAERHKTATQLNRTARTLLHDLKENVVTPYVMVEALGWFFSVPLFGKTLFPLWYHTIGRWLNRLFMPSLATTLTVEKITREEGEDMVAAEQQAQIRELVRERCGLQGAALSPLLLETIRKQAIGTADGNNGDVARTLKLSPQEEGRFYESLRQEYGISPRGVSERLQRITHTGFSTTEQAYFAEAALRLMGLTSNFSRVVVFCAHGSTSLNNPYESALDCGACGGNQGLPNARAIAAMANKPAVRELLQARGIKIPGDTHFFAAQHDTTSDHVRIVDMEDVPATHRKDLQRLAADLAEAGTQAALERGVSLNAAAGTRAPSVAQQQAQRRSDDWAQVRPEWGLSKNSLIVIGRRELTQTVNLHGRSFLHSYDHRQDTSGKLLETIMTAPLVVAQWINMEHYFSTVDNEVYGSGSKVYHNVAGRIGVMTGVWSDLRIGLPAQTVWNGREPYHEPMRLLAVIEAPRDRIRAIINRQPLLEQLFDRGWVTLVALEPQDGAFYQYDGLNEWTWIQGGSHDQLNTASYERNQDRGSGRAREVCH
ncbi:MAG: DUF2309 domain-containing protein [Nitrospirota bacterium]|nr:DUF2309 domain-containing protein [Nitrospirota bacterium]